jgi:hypothetical protein
LSIDEFSGLDIDGIQPKKSKKVNGKKKGNRTELELTKILSSRFNMSFSRSVGSGNRWAQASLTEQAKQVFSGDLIVPENFQFVIESKGGYEGIDINGIFIKGNSELDSFMQQVTEDSKRCGRKPMLCWKRARKPWLAFILTKDLIGHEFEYSIKYKEWTGIALEMLLKLEDSFFYNNHSKSFKS